MKSIKEQHQEVVNNLELNRATFRHLLGKDVIITMNDNEIRKGQVSGIGGYFLTIVGLGGTHDESLKGKTKIEYNDFADIQLI